MKKAEGDWNDILATYILASIKTIHIWNKETKINSRKVGTTNFFGAPLELTIFVYPNLQARVLGTSSSILGKGEAREIRFSRSFNILAKQFSKLEEHF